MMTKGQVPVVQYILFFAINFTVFLGIASLFKMQLERSKNEIGGRMIRMIGDDVSLNAVLLSVSCRECENGKVVMEFPKTVGKFYWGVVGAGDRIDSYLLGASMSYETTIFNLGNTIGFSGKSEGKNELKLLWDGNQISIE